MSLHRATTTYYGQNQLLGGLETCAVQDASAVGIYGMSGNVELLGHLGRIAPLHQQLQHLFFSGRKLVDEFLDVF
jgi:hypothetical protein